MINKLKEIYKDKIIEKVSEFDDNYYYFYYPNNKGYFGIEKSISKNEYNLLKTDYIEKIVYSTTDINQKVYEYLLENKEYPFKEKRKLLIFDKFDSSLELALKAFYKNVTIITFDTLVLGFCDGLYDAPVSHLSSLLLADTGTLIKIHDGIYISKATDSTLVMQYIKLIKKSFNHLDSYTDIANIITDVKNEDNIVLIKILEKIVLTPLFADSTTKDIIINYFRNDLNVSATAKTLYINRGTLLNKFDYIYKEIGLNLQKFSHACAMYVLITFSGEII